MNMDKVENILNVLNNSVIIDSQEDPDTPVHEFTSFQAMKVIKELSEELESLKNDEFININDRLIKRGITFTEWMDRCDEPDFNNQEMMWYVDFGCSDNVFCEVEPDMELFDKGLVHRNKDDAIAHAKALLSFTDHGGRNG